MTSNDDKEITLPLPLEDVVEVREDEEEGRLVLVLRGRTADVMSKLLFKGVMIHALDKFGDIAQSITKGAEKSDEQGDEKDNGE